MNRGMSCKRSEVTTKHALAGMKGHSHLVIWVNYKCCRPQGGKMSWTAVSADTRTHTLQITARIHGLTPSTAHRWTCYKKKGSLLWQPKSCYCHFIFLLNLSHKYKIDHVCRAHQQFFKVPVGFLLAVHHTKLLREAKNLFENRLRATFTAWISSSCVHDILKISYVECGVRMRLQVRGGWLNSTGAEVSECAADGNNTDSDKCIPNLQRRRGDIYCKTSNRHSVTGSPAPTVWRGKTPDGSKNNPVCLLQSASHASAWLGRVGEANRPRPAQLWNQHRCQTGRNPKPHRCNTPPPQTVSSQGYGSPGNMKTIGEMVGEGRTWWWRSVTFGKCVFAEISFTPLTQDGGKTRKVW